MKKQTNNILSFSWYDLGKRNQIYSPGSRNGFKPITNTHSSLPLIRRKRRNDRENTLIQTNHLRRLYSIFYDTPIANFSFSGILLFLLWSWNIVWKVNVDTSFWNSHSGMSERVSQRTRIHACIVFQMCVRLLSFYSKCFLFVCEFHLCAERGGGGGDFFHSQKLCNMSRDRKRQRKRNVYFAYIHVYSRANDWSNVNENDALHIYLTEIHACAAHMLRVHVYMFWVLSAVGFAFAESQWRKHKFCLFICVQCTPVICDSSHSIELFAIYNHHRNGHHWISVWILFYRFTSAFRKIFYTCTKSNPHTQTHVNDSAITKSIKQVRFGYIFRVVKQLVRVFVSFSHLNAIEHVTTYS